MMHHFPSASGLLRMVFAATLAFSPVRLSAATTLPSPQTSSGYVAYLLINETPFPGEQTYRSEADTMKAMDSILNVLIARLSHVPPHYRQSQIAAVTTDNIVDIITAGGVRGQVDGFYRNSTGGLKMNSRVTQRIDHLLSIANQGAPGRFARLLNHAVNVANTYARKKVGPSDPFLNLTRVNGKSVTGRAYSWMTDQSYYHPGGNFVRIPDGQSGSLGGNRFYTLRKNPQ